MNLDDCDSIFDTALSSTNETDFQKAIEPLFAEYKILSLKFGRGSIFWRARIINSCPYFNISELDYPPPELARRGRLNNAGEPCFYVSARKETALAEVGIQDGSFVQLAGFRILNESPVRLAVIGEYANVQKSGYMHFAGRDPNMVIAKILNAMPRQDALRQIYIDKFFAFILSDPNANKNQYLFSRALSQAIYSRNDSDGLVFPSVKDHGGFNIGIKAEASDKCFHNVCCVVVQVTRQRRFGVIDFNVVKAAEYLNDQGDFVWSTNRAPEIIGIYNMSKEEYDIASRNPDDRNGLLNMLHLHTNT